MKESSGLLAFALFWVLAAACVSAGENPMSSENRIATNQGDLVIRPIEHATFVMEWNGSAIYVDPVGGAEAFGGSPAPDLILITDIHGDHFDVPTIEKIVQADTRIVAPKEVAERLPGSLGERVSVLANGEKTEVAEIGIEAIPMYNTTPDRLRFHAKGRGNGYVLSMGGKRIYDSGDTEDIEEMRRLRDIDVAFVCMNLPYTMDVEQAASAVREFRPKVVYPFHYRGADGKKSDVGRFKKLVQEEEGIEVRLLGWYP